MHKQSTWTPLIRVSDFKKGFAAFEGTNKEGK
jgi:hypothetical protein